MAPLPTVFPAGGCGVSTSFPINSPADRASFPLSISGAGQRTAIGADLNATFTAPGITVQTAQVNTQQDAKLATWTGAATLAARNAPGRAMVVPTAAATRAVLRFDTIVSQAPQGKVAIAMQDASLPATALFARLAGKGKQTVKIPLACFTAKGVDLQRVDMPFAVTADAPFAAAFANIDILGGAEGDADTLRCEAVQ